MHHIAFFLSEWFPYLERPLTPVLGEIYWGNSLQTWILAATILVLVALLLRAIKGVVMARLRRVAEKTATEVDDAWVSVVDATAWFFYLAAGVLAAERVLDVEAELKHGLRVSLLVLVAVQGALWAQRTVSVFLSLWQQKQDSSASGTVAAGIRFVSRLVIWACLVLVVLSNLGVELSAVVAGLGVGGVAAALAVQKVLGDLFAGLSMYFDRPFDIGDFVIVGDVMGNVTKIGLRTTRIDGLGGEKIVCPNGELASKFIRNFQRMERRRIVFGFGIEYGLPASKVERAGDIAKEIISAVEGVRLDRSHFKEYGAYSLDFEVVYYVLSKDYNEYMDRQHEINMKLYRCFEEEGIPFAFPTSTVHLLQK
jgi:small-conductance mechanosensitive channel